MSWRHMGERRYSSIILDHSTRWMWMVSFMPHMLYLWERSPWYPLARRLGEPQSQSGCHGYRENSLASTKSQTQLPSPHPIAIMTVLSRLSDVFYIVQRWGLLDHFWPPAVNVMPPKTPFRLLIGLLQSQSHVTTFTHNYSLCCVTFTQLTIIHIRDYNHLLHS
jgi:hypothetical protein